MDRCDLQDCYVTLKLDTLDSLSKALCGDHGSLAAALHVILDKVATEVRRVIASKNSVNALSLGSLVKDILVHLHLRQASLTKSDCFRYWDYVSTFLSMILDLKLLLVHLSDSRKELRRAVLILCVHLNINRHQVWDAVVNGWCMKKKCLAQYLPEVVQKLVSWCKQGCVDPTQYLKFVVVLSSIAKCAKIEDDQRKQLKKALTAFETTFDFHEWFFSQDFSNVVPHDSCPTSKKLLRYLFEGPLTRRQLHSLCTPVASVVTINADLWRDDDDDMFFINNRRESVSTDVTNSTDALEGSLQSLERPDRALHIPLEDIVDSETVSSSGELTEDPVVFLESYLLSAQTSESRKVEDEVETSQFASTPKKRKSSFKEVDELCSRATEQNSKGNVNDLVLVSLQANDKKGKKRNSDVLYGSDAQKRKTQTEFLAADEPCEEQMTAHSQEQDQTCDDTLLMPQSTTKQQKDRTTSNEPHVLKLGGWNSQVENEIVRNPSSDSTSPNDTEAHGTSETVDSASPADNCAISVEPHQAPSNGKIDILNMCDQESDITLVCSEIADHSLRKDKSVMVNVGEEDPVFEPSGHDTIFGEKECEEKCLSGLKLLKCTGSDKGCTKAFEDDTNREQNTEAHRDQQDIFEANSTVVEISSPKGEKRNAAAVRYDSMAQSEGIDKMVNDNVVTDSVQDDDHAAQKYETRSPQTKKRIRTLMRSDNGEHRRLSETGSLQSSCSDTERRQTRKSVRAIEDSDEAWESYFPESQGSTCQEQTFSPGPGIAEQTQSGNILRDAALLNQALTECSLTPEEVVAGKTDLGIAHQPMEGHDVQGCALGVSVGIESGSRSDMDVSNVVASHNSSFSIAVMTYPVMRNVVDTETQCTILPTKLQNDVFSTDTNKYSDDIFPHEEKTLPMTLRKSMRLQRMSEAYKTEKCGEQNVDQKAASGRKKASPTRTSLFKFYVNEALNDPGAQTEVLDEGSKKQHERRMDMTESLSQVKQNINESSDSVTQVKVKSEQPSLWGWRPALQDNLVQRSDAASRSVIATGMLYDSAAQEQAADCSRNLANSPRSSCEVTIATQVSKDGHSEKSYTLVSQVCETSWSTQPEPVAQETCRDLSREDNIESCVGLAKLSAIISSNCTPIEGLPQEWNAEENPATLLRPRSTRRSAFAARAKMEEVYSKLSQRWRPQCCSSTPPYQETISGPLFNSDKGNRIGPSQCEVGMEEPNFSTTEGALRRLGTFAKDQRCRGRLTLTPPGTRVENVALSQANQDIPTKGELPQQGILKEVVESTTSSDENRAAVSTSPRQTRSSARLETQEWSVNNTVQETTDGASSGDICAVATRKLQHVVKQASLPTEEGESAVAAPTHARQMHTVIAVPMTRQRVLHKMSGKTVDEAQTEEKPGKDTPQRASARLKGLTPRAPRRL